MSTLYELSTEFVTAKNELESIEDLDSQVIEDTLKGLGGTLEEKAINVAKYIENEAAISDSISAAIKQMQARKKYIDNKRERLTSYLKENMDRVEITSINCPYFDLKIKKNPPSLSITDEEKVPDKYKTTETVTVTTIDKAAIKRDFKNNDKFECDGVVYINDKTRLEIK